MKTKTLFYASFTLAIVLSSRVACGNNNLFLPGDAFFPTVLTKHDVDTLVATKTGARTFAYSAFGGYEGAFCGYAGYENANIPAVDDAFAKNLATVYARIREYDGRKLIERTHDGKIELMETNGIRVLFYPADFQFPRYELGLRYNENWVADAVKFGHKREQLRLCSLIPDPEAVERDWRDAELVPPLKAKLPDVKLETVPRTEAPCDSAGRRQGHRDRLTQLERVIPLLWRRSSVHFRRRLQGHHPNRSRRRQLAGKSARMNVALDSSGRIGKIKVYCHRKMDEELSRRDAEVAEKTHGLNLV